MSSFRSWSEARIVSENHPGCDGTLSKPKDATRCLGDLIDLTKVTDRETFTGTSNGSYTI